MHSKWVVTSSSGKPSGAGKTELLGPGAGICLKRWVPDVGVCTCSCVCAKMWGCAWVSVSGSGSTLGSSVKQAMVIWGKCPIRDKRYACTSLQPQLCSALTPPQPTRDSLVPCCPPAHPSRLYLCHPKAPVRRTLDPPGLTPRVGGVPTHPQDHSMRSKKRLPWIPCPRHLSAWH